MTMTDYKHRDTIDVYRDDEEITVYNWANVKELSVVRGGNPTYEQIDVLIGAGDKPEEPEAVTTWLAEVLWREHGVEVEKRGIEVIDIESDDVEVVSPI